MTAPVGLLVLLGSLVGLSLALGVYGLTRALRARFPKGIAILGALTLSIVLGFGVFFLVIGIPMMSDPMASMGAAWAALGISLLVLLVISIGFGLLQARCWQIPKWTAMGAIGIQALLATLASVLMSYLTYPFADLLRGNNRDTHMILESFARSRSALGGVSFGLIVPLLLINFLHPLLQRRNRA